MTARQLWRCRKRILVLSLSLFKEPGGPEGVAVKGPRVGSRRRELHELLGFLSGQVELGHAKRRLNNPGLRGSNVVGPDNCQSFLIRLERVAVAPLAVELLAQLELDVAGLRLRRNGLDYERGGEYAGGNCGD